MMGAVQPFISGAISKTVNMPEEATVEEVEGLHQLSWELGLKAVAIYRDNCKVGQPLSTAKKGDTWPAAPTAVDATSGRRADRRADRSPAGAPEAAAQPPGRTFEFRVADCKGFATIGEYDDGRPGEIFLTVSKQGSTLGGIMDAFAKSISYGLQYGVPMRAFVEAFANIRFEPAGMTDDPDIRFACRSWTTCSGAGARVLDATTSGPSSASSRSTSASSRRCRVSRSRRSTRRWDRRCRPTRSRCRRPRAGGVRWSSASPPGRPRTTRRPAASCVTSDAPMCMQCGVQMMRAGSCHACPSCGNTSGCS